MPNDRGYRRTTTTTTTSRGRRPLYAPPPPPSNRRNHSALGYWVPLIVTGTIALGGLAAWVWAERDRDDDDWHPDHKPPAGPGGPYPNQGPQPYGGPGPQGGVPLYQGPVPSQSSGPQGMPPPVGGESASYYSAQSRSQETREYTEDGTFYGQVQGIMRRAPSPQQFFSSASKQVSGGLAAAGAALGLGSIMEEGNPDRYEARTRREEREGFSDHERWSEEADEQVSRRAGAVEAESERRADVARSGGKGRGKRTIAIVVSADTNMDGKMDEEDFGYLAEHASVLSYLPSNLDLERVDLFVLVYAPGLQSLPPLDYQPKVTTDGKITSGVGSSYSAISTPAVTPASELQSMSPRIDATPFTSPSSTFDALYLEAQKLVSDSSKILPFTTLDGFVPILRHLAPQMVYLTNMLSGDEGDSVAQLRGWVGHTILVIGDDGIGGLADTETEDEGNGGVKRPKWYETSSLVGLGKEVEVVDITRVGDDWGRRVQGRE